MRKAATTAHLYYDICSDDPKGLVGRCQEHDDDFRNIPEGYFYCEGCNRLMVENYTWELYSVCTDSGKFCLNWFPTGQTASWITNL